LGHFVRFSRRKLFLRNRVRVVRLIPFGLGYQRAGRARQQRLDVQGITPLGKWLFHRKDHAVEVRGTVAENITEGDRAAARRGRPSTIKVIKWDGPMPELKRMAESGLGLPGIGDENAFVLVV
jgi:hypothetical protein